MTKLYYDAGAWTIPGQQSREAARVDLPNGPAELATWLNERSVRPSASDAGANAPKAEAAAASEDPTAIGDWILDRASAAQIEQLFAMIGARFHELRKAAERGRAGGAP